MTKEQFQKFLEEKFKLIMETNLNANKEYASQKDAFLNFSKRVAELDKVDIKKVWYILAAKHDDAILNYINGIPVEGREPIENRILDRILYSFLLWGIIVEEKESRRVISNPNLAFPYPNSQLPG